MKQIKRAQLFEAFLKIKSIEKSGIFFLFVFLNKKNPQVLLS
jgi:hypothetical protein